MGLSACETPSPIDSTPAQIHPAATRPEAIKASRLSATLLYDILVASIASQRNNPAAALEALSRAAYQSRDHRIISRAIQLAMDMAEYQQAIELARLFSRLQPDNYPVILTLANAQFKMGEKQAAYALLVNLINQQETGDSPVLRDIATLLSRQDQSVVLSDFLQYVDNDPDNAQLVLTAAILAGRIENTEEFMRLLDKTLEIKPDWEYPAALKLSELSSHDPDSMTGFAEQYLAANPEHENFKSRYARILLSENQTDKALELMQSILALNPESAYTLFAIGAVYMEKGLPEQAKAALVRHLALSPNNDQARIYLSDIEFAQDNYTAAINYLHGVASQRYYLDAQIKIARIIARRNNVDSALQYLQQIDVYNDNDKTRLILEQGGLLQDHKLFHRSIRLLNQGLKQFPQQPDLLYNRGLLAAQLELLEVHERDMRKLIELQPDNAHAYNALGYTLADRTDRLTEAMELISKAHQLLPDNGFILDSMGWVHYRLGNTQQAIRFLRQALQVRQDAEIAAHLGEVLWVAGARDEALEIWRQGTEWGVDNTILQDTIKRLSAQP